MLSSASPLGHSRRQILAAAATAAGINVLPARALTAVEERNTVRVVKDPASGEPRFEPPLLFVEPGETVRFVMGGKAFASRMIGGMVPDGAEGWWGQVGEDVEVTFTEPGVYGHKCGSAYALGLVGLIVVGDPHVNLQEARRVQHPPSAADVLDELFSTVEQRQGS